MIFDTFEIIQISYICRPLKIFFGIIHERDHFLKVGVFAPTKLPVPVLPDKGRFNALFVAIMFPYTIVNPND